jgi:hypothetical protein
VGMRLMARDTVAVDTRARFAISRRFNFRTLVAVSEVALSRISPRPSPLFIHSAILPPTL